MLEVCAASICIYTAFILRHAADVVVDKGFTLGNPSARWGSGHREANKKRTKIADQYYKLRAHTGAKTRYL